MSYKIVMNLIMFIYWTCMFQTGFVFLPSIRLMLEVDTVDTTAVVTSSPTRIALMPPSTCWNLPPQWLEIHGTKANLNPYRIEGMKGKTKRYNGC